MHTILRLCGMANGYDLGGAKAQNPDCMGQAAPYRGRPHGRLWEPSRADPIRAQGPPHFEEWQTGQFMEYLTSARRRTSNAETRRTYEPLHSKQHRPRRDRSRPIHGIGDNGGRGPATRAEVYRGRNLRKVFRHSSAADRGRGQSTQYVCGGGTLDFCY